MHSLVHILKYLQNMMYIHKHNHQYANWTLKSYLSVYNFQLLRGKSSWRGVSLWRKVIQSLNQLGFRLQGLLERPNIWIKLAHDQGHSKYMYIYMWNTICNGKDSAYQHRKSHDDCSSSTDYDRKSSESNWTKSIGNHTNGIGTS